MKCQACHREMERAEPGFYHYTESGLDNVYLEGIDVFRCPGCDEQVPVIPRLKDLHRNIALALICLPEPLRGQEIRYLRRQMRYKSKDFAELIGVSPQTVSNWERKGAKPSPSHDRLIRTVCLLGLVETDSEFAKLVVASIHDYLGRLAQIEKERKERTSVVGMKKGGVFEAPYTYEYLPIAAIA